MDSNSTNCNARANVKSVSFPTISAVRAAQLVPAAQHTFAIECVIAAFAVGTEAGLENGETNMLMYTALKASPDATIDPGKGAA